MADEEWDFVLGINLTGLFKCLRAQLNRMSVKGSVVNISSTAGVHGIALNAHYFASKHGVCCVLR